MRLFSYDVSRNPVSFTFSGRRSFGFQYADADWGGTVTIGGVEVPVPATGDVDNAGGITPDDFGFFGVLVETGDALLTGFSVRSPTESDNIAFDNLALTTDGRVPEPASLALAALALAGLGASRRRQRR